MSLDDEKVKSLEKKQRKLRSIITMFHDDLQAELEIDTEKLKKTYGELREVQLQLLEIAFDNDEETESLKEAIRKYSKLMAEIMQAQAKQTDKSETATGDDGDNGEKEESNEEKEEDTEKNLQIVLQSNEDTMAIAKESSDTETEDVLMDIPEDPELNVGPKRELNILLLGETGAGKSTTINALANYLLYNSFEDAATGEFKQLIPSKFTLPNPETGAPYDIKLGEDENESFEEAGKSATQEPRGYVFPFGNTIIRLIDTPGMGDTRGAKVDSANFDKILAHLHLYKELHGICLLVKATETRKTNSFRYCINELLTYLHKDAVKNMVFCFTFSRNSFYGPGEGYATLRSFLSEELKEARIKMIPHGPHANCFFIDNEAFRYLVAKKTGYQFKSNQEKSYRESWHTSVEQTLRMFNRFLAERPHFLESTLSLNHARKVILQLAEPLARLQSKNSSNIQIIKEKEKSLMNTNKTKEDLAKSLHIQIDDLAAKELDMPYTVCTANTCTSILMVNGETKVDYRQKCHEPCYLTTVEAKKIGHPELQRCAAMAGTDTCTQCGCPWQLHMHTIVDYYRVKKTIVDVNKEREIKNADDAITAIEDFMSQSKQLIGEIENEMDVIHKVSAYFACILINYSNSPYNRFLEPYLNMLIDEEEKKINAADGYYSRNAKDKLVEMLDTHRENVKTMKRAIDENTMDNVQLKDIDTHLARLKGLKHTGPDLVQILETLDKTRVSEIAHQTASYSAFRPETTVSMGGGNGRFRGNGRKKPARSQGALQLVSTAFSKVFSYNTPQYRQY